jgi:hypothetical protein
MILVVGILIAVPGVVVFADGILHTVLGPTIHVPGIAQLNLERGTYVVFEHAGSGRAYGPITIRRVRGVTIDRSQLEVRELDGTMLEVRDSQPNQTIDRGEERYVSAVEFTTPRAGVYVLQLRTSEATDVMVHPPAWGSVPRSGTLDHRYRGWLAHRPIRPSGCSSSVRQERSS